MTVARLCFCKKRRHTSGVDLNSIIQIVLPYAQSDTGRASSSIVENPVPRKFGQTVSDSGGRQQQTRPVSGSVDGAGTNTTEQPATTAEPTATQQSGDAEQVGTSRRGDNVISYIQANATNNADTKFKPDLEEGKFELDALNDELVALGGVSIQAHGMAKQHPVKVIRDIINILNDGVDANRGGGRLYTDAFLRDKSNAGSATGTAGGVAYRDGAAMLLTTSPDGIRSVSDIDAILINDGLSRELPNLVSELQQAFPNMLFSEYSNAKDVVKRIDGRQQQSPQQTANNKSIETQQSTQASDSEAFSLAGKNESTANEVPQITAPEQSFKNKDEAQQWGFDNVVGTFTNEQTQETINISKRSVIKFFSGKAISKSKDFDEHTSVIAGIPELIRKAKLGETQADKDGNKDIKDVQKFYGIINGKAVKLTVKRYKDKNQGNKAYSYEVQEIKTLDGINYADADNATSPSLPPSVSVESLAENFDIVKENEAIKADLEKQLPKGYADKVEIDRTGKSAGKQSLAKNKARGWYSGGDKVYINPDNIRAIYDDKGNEVLSKSEHIAFVAWHELGHRGFKAGKAWQTYRKALQEASHNKMVGTLAGKIKKAYEKQGKELTNEQAVEEALVELNAAVRTNSMKALEENWGITTDMSSKSALGKALKKVADVIRRVVNAIKGEKHVMSDQQVMAIVQSITDNAIAPITQDNSGTQFSLPPTDAELQAEFDDTASRYGGEEAYNQDKADDKTKLNYRQWVQVRTPRFKQWFGDWEKLLRLDKLRQSKPIVITGKEVRPDGDLDKYKENAWAFGKTIRDTFTNKDSGKKIKIVGNSIKEVLQHDYKNAEQLQSVAAIPKIIEEGILIDTLPNEDKTKRPDIEEYDYYVVGLNIGGVDYTVRAAVGVTKGGDLYYDHKLTQIEKGELLSLPSRITNPVGDNISPFNINDKRLLSILQVGDVSKVTDPDTGEPLVVYHGTNQNFSVFSKEHLGNNTNARSATAFFFTTDAREAGEYADAAAKSMVSNQDEVEAKTEQLLKEINDAENKGDWVSLWQPIESVKNSVSA